VWDWKFYNRWSRLRPLSPQSTDLTDHIISLPHQIGDNRCAGPRQVLLHTASSVSGVDALSGNPGWLSLANCRKLVKFRRRQTSARGEVRVDSASGFKISWRLDLNLDGTLGFIGVAPCVDITSRPRPFFTDHVVSYDGSERK
jgi:hypothetical protein